jgi:hypothetical protein
METEKHTAERPVADQRNKGRNKSFYNPMKMKIQPIRICGKQQRLCFGESVTL